MSKKIRVILITDGDRVAQRAVEDIAASLNLRCISASAGNPTPIGGAAIVELLRQTPYDPVLVMFDDKGYPEKGDGERALEFVAKHPDVQVLGAVAVASNTTDARGARADICIAKDGMPTRQSVNKNGDAMCNWRDGAQTVVRGDTVDILGEVDVPVVVGVGDIGKMRRRDEVEKGAPVTRRAIEEILRRSGISCGG